MNTFTHCFNIIRTRALSYLSEKGFAVAVAIVAHWLSGIVLAYAHLSHAPALPHAWTYSVLVFVAVICWLRWRANKHHSLEHKNENSLNVYLFVFVVLFNATAVSVESMLVECTPYFWQCDPHVFRFFAVILFVMFLLWIEPHTNKIYLNVAESKPNHVARQNALIIFPSIPDIFFQTSTGIEKNRLAFLNEVMYKERPDSSDGFGDICNDFIEAQKTKQTRYNLTILMSSIHYFLINADPGHIKSIYIIPSKHLINFNEVDMREDYEKTIDLLVNRLLHYHSNIKIYCIPSQLAKAGHIQPIQNYVYAEHPTVDYESFPEIGEAVAFAIQDATARGLRAENIVIDITSAQKPPSAVATARVMDSDVRVQYCSTNDLRKVSRHNYQSVTNFTVGA